MGFQPRLEVQEIKTFQITKRRGKKEKERACQSKSSIDTFTTTYDHSTALVSLIYVEKIRV